MKVINIIMFCLSIWAILIALVSPPVDLFFVLLLIGTLICLSLGEFFIDKKSMAILKSISYILIGVFVFIVLNKIYQIIK